MSKSDGKNLGYLKNAQQYDNINNLWNCFLQ